MALALLAVAASVALELLAGPGHVLDPSPWRGPVWASVALVAVLFAVLAWSFAGRRATLGLLLSAWALVWGPQAQRSLQVSPALGWVPAGVIGLTSWAHPPTGVVLGVVGPALGVLARRARFQSSSPVAGVDPGPHPDVLLVTVDTVRADSELVDLGRFPAEDGWVHYEGAVAPAPWTLPAMISVMRGLPVAQHGGGLPAAGGFTSPVDGASLAERFAARGYLTHALVSNPHLRSGHGFGAGFQTFQHSDDSREPLAAAHAVLGRWSDLRGRVPPVRAGRDRRLVDRAVRLIESPADDPRLVWVHLLGPHEYARAPQNPPPAWVPGTEDLDVLRAAYAGNVEVARDQVLALAAAADGWVIAVTSDHGEAFGEGGYRGHGRGLQDAELRVPLVVRRPGQAGGVHREQVALHELGDWLLGSDEAALEARQTVSVGGVRADAGAFAQRHGPDVYDVDEAPAPSGSLLPMSSDTRSALEELGYIDHP